MMELLTKLKQYNRDLKEVPGLLRTDRSSNVIVVRQRKEKYVDDNDIAEIWDIAVRTFSGTKFKSELRQYFQKKQAKC